MKIEALPAEKGDCLLLHHEWNGEMRLILIDGGPGGVFSKTLKPRLQHLRRERINEGAIGPNDPLVIDLVIVSHIDDDHINGVKALFEYMKGQMNKPNQEFRVDRLWHNSFRSLVDVRDSEVSSLANGGDSITASLSDAIAAEGKAGDLGMVLASIPQGYELLGLAKTLGIAVNPEFDHKAIEATEDEPLSVDGLKVHVLGPLRAELDALRADFAKWLKKKKEGEEATASLLASFTDKSVANLSSIVLLVEKDGKKFLLTGDARGDKIVDAAEKLGLLQPGKTLPVDVFKVPHHGSDRNNDKESFAAFPARRYIFSGDGKHGNPERNTFQSLAAVLRSNSPIVELTYTPAEIDVLREMEWKKHNNGSFDHAARGIVPFLEAESRFKLRYPGKPG